MCSDHNLPEGIFLILFFVSLIDDIFCLIITETIRDESKVLIGFKTEFGESFLVFLRYLVRTDTIHKKFIVFTSCRIIHPIIIIGGQYTSTVSAVLQSSLSFQCVLVNVVNNLLQLGMKV